MFPYLFEQIRDLFLLLYLKDFSIPLELML